MIYLLDTNRISALMRADSRMAEWLSSVAIDDRVVMCTITRGEILFGLGRLAQGRRRDLEAKAQKLFDALPCEPIPPAAGDFYANVKMAQQRRGLPLDVRPDRIALGKLAFGPQQRAALSQVW